MTIERHDPEAGIKVVPMYLEGEEQPREGEVEPPAERAPRGPGLGILGLAFGVLTVAATVAAIVIASSGDYGLGTITAYGAIALSVLAVLAGVVSVVLGFGRRWGVLAVLLGVLANPLVLLVILRFFSGFQG